jgi:zinc transport system substrate-binding protein
MIRIPVSEAVPMKKQVFLTVMVLAAAMGLTAADTKVPKSLVVSILPQKYFIDRIGGGVFNVMVLVGPGQSPHSYEPTPRQMADLAAAAAWLSIGVDFEKALKPKVRALYPGLKIVDTTLGVRYRNLEAHHHEDEVEHEAEAGDESGSDPHIWLGRAASKVMAANIRDALAELDPAGTSKYTKNCEVLVREIDSVFDDLAKDLAAMKGKPVFVYHPAFGYFLDEFGIRQEAVELGGKEPTQKDLAVLIEEAKAEGAKVVFVQAQFSSNAAKTIAKSIGGVVETIDPLAPDWLENLKRMGAALKKALR